MSDSGGLGQFRRDLGWAITTSTPSLLMALTVVLSGVSAAFGAAGARHHVLPGVAILALPAIVFNVGFLGTQRVWFLYAQQDQVMTGKDIWSLSWRFFWRFVRLGLLAGFLDSLLVAVVRPWTGHNALIWSTAIVGLVGDVLLTFVVPALVFTTDSVTQAGKLGLSLLARSWRQSWPYLLTPGLTLVSVGQVWGSRGSAFVPAVVIATVGSVLGLWFKGAIVRHYLRWVPKTEPYIKSQGVRRRARTGPARAGRTGAPPAIIPERTPDDPSIFDIADRMQRRPDGREDRPE